MDDAIGSGDVGDDDLDCFVQEHLTVYDADGDIRTKQGVSFFCMLNFLNTCSTVNYVIKKNIS